MTEKEKFMYNVMGKISKSDAPIVFKGAMVTKLILTESGYSTFERQTKDIDANWVGAPPSMEVLTKTINTSLGDLNNQYYATAYRAYEENKSAGVSIRRKDNNDEIILMDISIKPVHSSKIYHYGELEIRGVLMNEILADKLTVMSKRLIFRRTKDVVDIYALAHCVKIHSSDIFEIFKRIQTGRSDRLMNSTSTVQIWNTPTTN